MINALLSYPVRLRAKAYLATLVSAIKRQQHDLAYRVYVTDTLKIIAENTAIPAAYCSKGESGKYNSVRWIDAVDPKPEDTRTPEEVIAHIRGKIERLRGEEN